MLTTYIARTDTSCVIDGISFSNLPLLLTNQDILVAQSDYLRHLAVTRGFSLTTVREVSKYLRTHVHIMDAEGLSWEQTNESALRRWRSSQGGPNPSNASRRYINQQLHAIYQFLIWAERTNRVSQVVGPLSPDDKSSFLLPVEINRCHRDGTVAQFKLPLLYRSVGETDRRNATAQQIDDLYVALANESNSYLAERNQLIARFAENCLMRRHEIVAFTMSQLPSLDEAHSAREAGGELTIALHITKGMKARETVIDPQLVVDTWAFISSARASLLRSKRKRDAPSHPIFLSWRTGEQIHPDSISNLFAAKQKEAGIQRASAHHLRSIGATNRVDSLIAMYEQNGAPMPDEDTLLLQVTELLGHASQETSKRYIRRSKKREQDRNRAAHNFLTDRDAKLRELDREIALRQDKLRRLIDAADAHTKNTPKV